jgi:hypothetical protein
MTRADKLAALMAERYGDPEALAAEAWTPTPDDLAAREEYARAWVDPLRDVVERRRVLAEMDDAEATLRSALESTREAS